MDGLIAEPVAPSFVPHWLHGPDRCWPETNCYVDLWIELLASLGFCPEAALGFAITQDYERDQFTFSKFLAEDLRCLYGLETRELSIYHSVEQHASLHTAQGAVVLTEVDAFYLPDTAATTYRRNHSKTTIAIDAVDRDSQICSYFHNATRGVLVGEDYLGALRLKPEFGLMPDVLPPYVEVVRRCSSGPGYASLRSAAHGLLAAHLARRPSRHPFSAWRLDFEEHVTMLLESPHLFHDYAFHFPRMMGANFELLGSHLAWLGPSELDGTALICGRIAHMAKVVQFRLARCVARRRVDLCGDCFESLESDYEAVVNGLVRYLS